mmetsp:Transcript_50565/g.109761  ORF Transcript_50565/g.109761 Transcript_50565/m.109761 type:complete len:126 (+) Transcript_50565:674-1051(+)
MEGGLFDVTAKALRVAELFNGHGVHVSTSQQQSPCDLKIPSSHCLVENIADRVSISLSKVDLLLALCVRISPGTEEEFKEAVKAVILDQERKHHLKCSPDTGITTPVAFLKLRINISAGLHKGLY